MVFAARLFVEHDTRRAVIAIADASTALVDAEKIAAAVI
jgi:hypothetical protein